MRPLTICLTAVLIAASATPAPAETLRYAFQADANTLDPHSLNETFTLGFLGNIYEGLTRRGSDLSIEPSLAESWELVEPTRWRFTLRQGVTFHNGNPFTADDVIFSYERAMSEGSDMRHKLAGVITIEAIDEYTIEIVTNRPNPILIAEWDTWYIMDREWAEANRAFQVTNISDRDQPNFANLNANGTGPFMVVTREPDVRTIAVPHPDWWGTPRHNLTEVIFEPIPSDSTRVAALLAGDTDVIFPVPLQDIARIERNNGTRVMSGPELRTLFVGMDQARDQLLYSSVEGTNPLRDRRVRLAFYQAIDIAAIRDVVMRGQSTPSASLVAPGIRGFPEGLQRYSYDPEVARALLAEAGYPEGFQIRLDCPNNRYVNDEDICIALAGMLGRIGIRVDLRTETRSVYFGRILAQGGYDTSLYLLGWTPASFDSYNPLYNLVSSRDGEGRGRFNIGGYSNAAIDVLSDEILEETDLARRDAMIYEAWELLHEDVGYLPLHQQALAWGVADYVDLVQRADNQLDWTLVNIEP